MPSIVDYAGGGQEKWPLCSLPHSNATLCVFSYVFGRMFSGFCFVSCFGAFEKLLGAFDWHSSLEEIVAFNLKEFVTTKSKWVLSQFFLVEKIHVLVPSQIPPPPSPPPHVLPRLHTRDRS
jgi:hypothetical protein